MSAKEITYTIFNQLSEDQLKGFIIFEELEKLHRPILDIDEENELDEWRTEKYKI